MRIQELLDQRN